MSLRAHPCNLNSWLSFIYPHCIWYVLQIKMIKNNELKRQLSGLLFNHVWSSDIFYMEVSCWELHKWKFNSNATISFEIMMMMMTKITPITRVFIVIVRRLIWFFTISRFYFPGSSSLLYVVPFRLTKSLRYHYIYHQSQNLSTLFHSFHQNGI